MNNILNSFDKSKCCGCGSCINICPTKALTFGKDENYFTTPVIEEKDCIECGRCISVCPYNNIKTSVDKHLVYAAVNKNEEILRNSSSGGILGEIAKIIIENGGIVFGCEMDGSYNVKHIPIYKESDLIKIQKSKYVQSYTGDTFKQAKDLLKQGKRVLYTGTPCMIAGLKSFLGKMADHKMLITVDVVCHGVPSQELFNHYLKTLQNELGEQIQKYTFRAKRRIRNGMEWNVMYETLHHKYYRNWPEDSYNYYYMKGATYRDSCYSCPFASPVRYSDITLCDYWHWDSVGLHFDEFDSVSGIIINTELGENLFDSIKRNLTIKKSSFEDVSKYNSCLTTPTPRNSKREELLALWKSHGYDVVHKAFKNKYRLQILKYKIMRHIHPSIINFIHKNL